MDTPLPIWAQPHRFWLLRAGQEPLRVFTFGLVLNELRPLASSDGVRSFGARFGYEWLEGLSAGVRAETRADHQESRLSVWLRETVGLVGPNEVNDVYLTATELVVGEPPDAAVAEFARNHGRPVRDWALNAFGGLDLALIRAAGERTPLPHGYEHAAARRLTLTPVKRGLVAVNSLDGRAHWAARYTSLYERVALELEDLAIRHPRIRRCSLCHRLYVPLQRGQATCGNNQWDNTRRTLVTRCTPTTDEPSYISATSADRRRRRKTAWTRMQRTRLRYGDDHELTIEAIKRWQEWQRANPAPRPPGRPPRPLPARPPYAPSSHSRD